MKSRRGNGIGGSLPHRVAGALSGLLLLALTVVPAQATLLPEGFFDMAPAPGHGPAAVEANTMAYNGSSDTVAAQGAVVMHYQGYDLRADKVEYDQATGGVKASGHVTVRDPQGNIYQADSIVLTGGMKEAFIDSLTLTTNSGARITARSVDYKNGLETILSEASYSPCGLCIDSKGRKIGWKVKSAQITYDRNHASVYLQQPSLELLGIPVAWIPWFWIPDPSQPRALGPRMPSVGISSTLGATLTTPYFVPVGDNIDVLLTPELMSKQGVLLGGKVNWRLPGYGEIEVKASGLRQLDPSAFAGTVGDRQWRGAIQTSGRFTPLDHWTAGWSYSTFTDQQYLTDYGYTDADSYTNRAYGTYLNEMTYFDIRVEQGQQLGNYPGNDPAQAVTLPQSSFEHIQDLAPGYGRLHLTGELLSLVRGADQYNTYNSVPYVTGYQGDKQHLMLEGGWENQYIAPGGVAVTPYLAGRLDVANYNRSASPIGTVGTVTYPTASDAFLFSLTPIAAMDVRFPMVAKNGFDTHLLEPVAQLVYRGSTTTDVGVTNDDAQSFVFDTTNLFSYNKFSGIDRQDTGLRANLGGHYLANFADGSWLDLVAGESFHLLGTNAFGISDAAQTGTDSGLGSAASYLVGSARGGFGNGITAAGKVQLDPSKFKVTRAGVGASYSLANGFSANGSYIYVAADPNLGTTADQHEVEAGVNVPIADYWSLQGDYTYDIGAGGWTNADAGITYDDGYFVLGGAANIKPTSWGFGLKFNLKGPDHKSAF
ncbi:MAG: LPS-assembly protein LptD [Devosia sp.]